MAFLDKNGLARLWANILSLMQSYARIGQETDAGSADTINGAKNFTVDYVDSQLDTYILNIDYDTLLAFDTSEIVIGTTSTTSVLGQAILGQMVLA